MKMFAGRGIWREASERRWNSLEELNAWLQKACVEAWEQLQHPEWVHMSVADVYQDERLRLMPNPRPFDGYIEHPARVSATGPHSSLDRLAHEGT